jgi:hypothetical protein
MYIISVGLVLLSVVALCVDCSPIDDKAWFSRFLHIGSLHEQLYKHLRPDQVLLLWGISIMRLAAPATVFLRPAIFRPPPFCSLSDLFCFVNSP